MSENKFTPGPWVAVLQFGQWYVRQDPKDWDGMGYQHIATMSADRKGSHYGDMFAANARLCASAPDLLEALEMLDRVLKAAWASGALPASILSPAEIGIYQAAIHKARGKV